MPYPTVSQLLVTIHHDGRYEGPLGNEALQSFVSGRAWNIEGVSNANAIAFNAPGTIVISTSEYERLLKIAGS